MKIWFILLNVLLLISNNYVLAETERGFDVVAKQQRKIALVIGNNNYQYAPTLNSTIRDSQDIGEILHKRNFKVTYLENATQAEMDTALEKFYSNIKLGDVGLLYFAGHGMEFQRNNFLIPIDANLKARSDAKYKAIPLNQIIERMSNSKNKLNIIVLDACRNNPFKFNTNAREAGSSRGFAQVEPPEGMFIAYATSAGQITMEGKDNGLFTKYLKSNMKKPLELATVFKKTKDQVYKESTSIPKQRPAIYNEVVKGNFYFTNPVNPINPTDPDDNLSPEARKIILKTKLACKLKIGGECYNLGRIYYDGKIVKKDKQQAAKYYQKACKLKYGVGCSYLGTMYSLGEEVKKNKLQAAKYYQQACELKEEIGCYALGLAYYGGVGVKKNKLQAARFFQQACELKIGRGCYNLGLLYERGEGVKKNKLQAMNFYQQACNNVEYNHGCHNLGRAYEEGDLVIKSIRTAKKFFKIACSLGDKEACEEKLLKSK